MMLCSGFSDFTELSWRELEDRERETEKRDREMMKRWLESRIQ